MTTPVWFTGFEYGLSTISINGAGLADSLTGSCTLVDTPVHIGSYAMKCTATGGTAAYIGRTFAAGTKFVGRFYVYFPTLPIADRTIFSISTVGHAIQITYDQSINSLALGIDGAVTTPALTTVSTLTWYCIDVLANTADNPWRTDWQIDEAAQTQNTYAHASENMSGAYYGLLASGTQALYYDDIIHSLTVADYPIGGGGTYGLRPTSDGAHNNAANTMEDSAGNDIDGVNFFAYPKLDEDPWASSISSDYIKQSTIGAARYCAVNFADVTNQPGGFIGVEGLLEYGSSGTAANTGGCIIKDNTGTETAVWGIAGALQDYSNTTAYYKHAIVSVPAGGWTKTEIDALYCRFGFSDDVTDVPRWVAIMLEVAFLFPIDSILMTNAAEDVEWVDTDEEMRMTNAGENIEQHLTVNDVRMTNAAIMIEWRAGAIGASASHAHTADEPALSYTPPPADYGLVPEGPPIALSTATSLFAQFEPGGIVYYLGPCFALEEIPNPRASYMPIIHRVGSGDYIVADDRPDSPPDMIDFTITRLHSKTANWLDKIGCRFTLFTLQRCWGPEGVFNNWVVGQSVSNCKIINDPIENVQQRENADEMVHNYEIVGYFPRRDYYEMITSLKTHSGTTDANCISTDNSDKCGCGTVRDTCQTLFVGFDAAGPAASAHVLYSTDRGVTWVQCTTDPFAVGLNITALKSLWVDAKTMRIIAFRDGTALEYLECCYSDDVGATWTSVIVGDDLGEGVISPNALCVYDRLNIWIGTDSGRIYFSSDAGETWDEESEAITHSIGKEIYGIDFLSSDFGLAVGNNELLMLSRDGGVTWDDFVFLGADIFYDIQVFTTKRWLYVCSDGYTYMTYNGGITWTTLRNWSLGTYGDVKSLDFVDDMTGFMIAEDSTGIGYLLRSIDGGYSWTVLEKITASSGMNEVIGCGYNEAFAVGDSAVILEGNGFSTLM